MSINGDDGQGGEYYWNVEDVEELYRNFYSSDSEEATGSSSLVKAKKCKNSKKTKTPSPTKQKPMLPLEEVLSTEKIRKKLLELLSFKDLLHCSVVSRKWKLHIRDYLRRSTNSSLTVTFQEASLAAETKTLLDILKDCSIFPCSTLKVRIDQPHSCTPALRYPVEAELRFQLLPAMNRLDVKNLSVIDSNASHRSDCHFMLIIMLFLRRIKRVEYLQVGVDNFTTLFMDKDEETTLDKLIFPELKVFASIRSKLTQPKNHVYGLQVLDSSKLESFWDPIYSQQLGSVRNAGKCRTLKICNLYGVNGLYEMQYFAEGKPELVTLVFYGIGSPKNPTAFYTKVSLKLIFILKNICRSCCNTLVEFRTNLPILNAVVQNCNSVLEQLKVLDLHYDHNELNILNSLNLNHMFPRLLTVYFRAHYDHDSDIIVPEIFYECDYLDLKPSLTVQNLIVQLNIVPNTRVNEFKPSDLELVARAFPNIQTFSMHNHMGVYMSKKFTKTIKALMRTPWPELERLEIVTGLAFKDLEAIFIGVSSQELQHWDKFRVGGGDLSSMEFVPTAPSIRDFRKLKIFQFVPFSTKDAEERMPKVVGSDVGGSSFIYNLECGSEEDYHNRGKNKPFSRWWSESGTSLTCKYCKQSSSTSGFRCIALGPCVLLRLTDLRFHYVSNYCY